MNDISSCYELAYKTVIGSIKLLPRNIVNHVLHSLFFLHPVQD